ncbi:MAG TPA: phage/plasmid primase, P4 family [Chloroflexota bacterium]|nr:phage/plasmid primase, P4 family [Chloroflexota bacterium]
MWAVQVLTKTPSAGPSPRIAVDSLPPVRLGDKGVRLWQGELAVDKADGRLKASDVVSEIDTSETLCALGGELAKAGAAETTIRAALAERDRVLGYHKYDARKGGGLEEYARIAAKVTTEKPMVVDLHTTDMGNAQRLVALHGADLRYCQANRQWYLWDGRRWAPDGTGEVYRRAQDTVAVMYHQALKEPDHDRKEALLKWALRSEGRDRIEAMVALARSSQEMAVTPAQLDANPWLLNVMNGTLDLRTGHTRPPNREDLITKLAPVQYNRDANLPLWDRFITDLTNDDPELAAFLQRAVGYSLTGDTREEVLFFGHGPSATGKSTFIEAVKATFGDYASTADFETFLARRDAGGPRNDIARLGGSRFVASVEVDEGKRLAEGLIKMLTGGDTVSARFLYQETFEFRPRFKLWLMANDPPKVRDNDDALWRRILRVPFVHSVPKDRRDPAVKATLRDPKTAGPAVLAWAVRGCLEWQKGGLKVPQVVEHSTETYRQEMDPLRLFLDERCTLDQGRWTPSAELRSAYETWARESGEPDILSGRAFAERLRALGCTSTKKRVQTTTKDRSVSTWGWQGIGLVEV